jgi:hypothetical protein
VNKFHNVCNINLDVEASEFSIHNLSTILGLDDVVIRKLSIDEVKFDSASAPGLEYEHVFIDKYDMFQNARGEIDEYCKSNKSLDIFFKVSGKQELLPKKKILDGKCRTFMFANTLVYFKSAQLFQDFNNKLKGVCSVGFTPYYGGMQRLASELKGTIIEGDLTGYDRNFPNFLFDVCRDLRLKVTSDFNEGDRAYIRFYYEQVKNTHLVLPDGRIVLKSGGNPSGTNNTTYDNTIGHAFVWLYMFRKLTKRDINVFLTFRLRLYADDHIVAIPNEYKDVFSFSNRKSIYSEFGLQLKAEDDFISKDVDGHKFLGFKIVKYKSMYVPIFPEERAIVGLSKTDRRLSKMTTEYYKELLIGYAPLLCFSKYFDKILEEEKNVMKELKCPRFIDRDKLLVQLGCVLNESVFDPGYYINGNWIAN